jgi:hypothetical protein
MWQRRNMNSVLDVAPQMKTRQCEVGWPRRDTIPCCSNESGWRSYTTYSRGRDCIQMRRVLLRPVEATSSTYEQKCECWATAVGQLVFQYVTWIKNISLFTRALICGLGVQLLSPQLKNCFTTIRRSSLNERRCKQSAVTASFPCPASGVISYYCS